MSEFCQTTRRHFTNRLARWLNASWSSNTNCRQLHRGERTDVKPRCVTLEEEQSDVQVVTQTVSVKHCRSVSQRSVVPWAQRESQLLCIKDQEQMLEEVMQSPQSTVRSTDATIFLWAVRLSARTPCHQQIVDSDSLHCAMD